MRHFCPITRLRDRLGMCVQLAARDGERMLFTRNGQELAGLDEAAGRSMDYKAHQVAQEPMRWRIVKEGLEGGMGGERTLAQEARYKGEPRKS